MVSAPIRENAIEIQRYVGVNCMAAQTQAVASGWHSVLVLSDSATVLLAVLDPSPGRLVLVTESGTVTKASVGCWLAVADVVVQARWTSSAGHGARLVPPLVWVPRTLS